MREIESIVRASSSDAVKALNPHLFGSKVMTAQPKELHSQMKLEVKPSTDVEKLNKTEKEFLAWLERAKKEDIFLWVGVQNITLKLADDTRYTPDFSAVNQERKFVFFETKGFMRDDALVKIKVAARQFPWAEIRLVKKEQGQWVQTPIKP